METALLKSTWPTMAGAVLLSLVGYFLLRAIYNLYFHPLKDIPGPKSWSATRLPYIWALLRGTFVHDIQKLHRKYGPILRIAPNELTFTHPSAWNDILQSHHGRPPFPKDPTWWTAQRVHTEGLLTALNHETHARMRKALTPGFTTRALRSQEPIIQRYVNLLVERLSEMIDSPSSGEEENKGVAKAEVDISPWFNFVTFDIFGDLAFGESFHCLENNKYHPWVAILFHTPAMATKVAAARFYPWLEFVLFKLIPPSLRKMQQDHWGQVVERVARRMNYEVEREDIMSPILRGNTKNEMSLDDINGSFMALVIAGSETTATALTGMMNYLVQNPQYLRKVTDEVRGLGDDGREITLDSLRELKWLNAVLTEALRLCTPVPWILPRQVPDAGGVVAGVTLPGQTLVSIQAYAMQRDPKYWRSADEFLPERWLPDASKPESEFYTDKREAFQPFSMGPRICLGIHLAWAEMRLITTKLLRAFDFEAVDGKRLEWESLKTFMLVERKPVVVRMRHASH
ncbi:Putative cytochrome P450 pisatin demethylase-like [Podospora comata]|uniref:Cytochrome P450 pisatin demethylase-like n=1 Tax=Podospora comata TaxID=48703 RepID=A0ABY6S8D7_PODCO|nr:Putative cytochrome P450 pisatin demethylase-like [Podospora comata]